MSRVLLHPIKLLVAALLIAIAIVACEHKTPASRQAVIEKIEKDTMLPAAVKLSPVAADKDDDFVTPSLQEIVDTFKAMYNNHIMIDTSFFRGKDQFHVVYEYRCLRDSGVVVPEKFVSMYGMQQFVTHHFKSDIAVYKNGKTIAATDIYNDMFNIDEERRACAVLFTPQITFNLDHVLISHSLSIPLTDIGEQVLVRVYYNGNVSAEPSYD
ncbi:hypothetical protein SAMN05428949_6004 [Chitinophaga sp. YR627]|uniref:hypothetical protein n=1 Tax=Chitinophaga sp. YR627 TaxID=1881041 RepID=UPI0008E01A35|nr:hypothetical protein [Chitinophaga sp. YR627]SFO65853.1 hypothetical protein SAMN05428949_6004 [Chitinophaga sp. YR627]